MIGEESYWVTHALEIVAPMIQGVDNSKEFSIIDVVITLGCGECLREICARMKVTIVILLH